MSSIEYRHTDGDDFITELDHRGSSDEPAEIYGHLPYRHARLSVSLSSDASVLTVTVEILNGLSVVRDDLTPNKLSYDGTATVTLGDYSTVDIPITNGLGEQQVDVSSVSGTELTVSVESLTDSPISGDTTTVDLPSGGGST